MLTLFFSLAQFVQAQEGLTLHEASRRVLANNPKLQVFQWRFKAIDGLRQTADFAPAYEVGIEAENLLGTGDFSGTEQAEVTLSLSSVIELGGKRDARVAVADSRYALAQAQRQAKALDVLGQVTQRYIATLSMQEKIQVARDATQLAETSYRLVSQRVARAVAPEAERLRAQAALIQARQREAALRAALRSRLMALATLWGAENADFNQLRGNLFTFESADTFETLFQRLVNSPAIQIFASQARLRDAEVELARSQSSSNAQWSLGIKRVGDSGDSALAAGISIPLFTGRRNRGEMQSALAAREMVDYRKQATLLELRSRLFEAWQKHQQSVAAARQLRAEVLPFLQKALIQTRQAYERGRYSYIDWVSAQRELLEARLTAIDAATTALLNQALIEQLTAEPLSAGAFSPQADSALSATR
ncbi:TolC family protein [Sedimenticola sp.]|uniref:TolC family protein n=1 Tax=Sedimenticola sp. TaxID=1940285 RepID=UPI003D0C4EEA